MTRRSKKFSAPLTVFLAVVCLLAGCCVGVLGGGTYDALSYRSDVPPRLSVSGELQVHFLELGNKYDGDCIYIKAGDTDVLIDAGSRASSVPAIDSYLRQYVTDGKLEYVIVTHAHEDHYAGFAITDGSIFDLYECGTVIDFAKTNQKPTNASGTQTQYGRYLSELADEVAAGAVHYSADQCISGGHSSFELADGITLQILDSYYYYNDADTENDYSVCCLLTYGSDSYLFTGDLEAKGEEYLVSMNKLPEVTVYKAGHHGSKTSSSEALLSVIRPDIVCVSCCCGSPEYTKTDANQFPTQAFVNRIAPYTDKVYVTTLCLDYDAGTYESMNGAIVVLTDRDGVRVVCSAGDGVLRDSPWFAAHRTCPADWAA